jgi:membrane-associated phospholipid phosphatase
MKDRNDGKINTIDKKIHNNLIISNTTGGNPVDTCLKYSPTVLLFFLDRQGFQTKNSFKSQVLKLLIGGIILEAASSALKHIVKRVRPNGEPYSFPSSHTGTCILGAELLHAELKENYPALSSSGYVLAVITALLRMYHNKHWFSDVVSGALLGFIAFHLSSNIMADRRLESVFKEKEPFQSLFTIIAH